MLPKHAAVSVVRSDGHDPIVQRTIKRKRSVVPNADAGPFDSIVVGLTTVVVSATGQCTACEIQNRSSTGQGQSAQF